MSDDAILKVENVSKHFSGVTALEKVSFSLEKGEVLCLVGENGSGKSTMIKIISGIYTPDSGCIYLNRKPYKKITPIQSINEGVQVIYQDFSLFPNLTVAENLAINEQLSSKKAIVNWKEIFQIASEGLAEINISIPLDMIVENLPTSDRQLIALTKALLAKARLIIMDEPTTALTQKEIQSLFHVINDLKKQGISIIFVSHKLNEIVEIADRVLVFRNGKKVFEGNAKELSIKEIEFHMTGRRINERENNKEKGSRKVASILNVNNLNKRNCFYDVSFDLKPKEVLGITGLLGSGRTELALALFGDKPIDSGEILISGKEVKIRNIQDAISNGIGYVPEDRIREGLCLDQSIKNNIVIRVIDQLVNKFHFLDNKIEDKTAHDWISQLEVKTPSSSLPAKSLSGGNQQRLVLAKWLASYPKILILNGPTVGVDVGSKMEIHKLIRNLAIKGMGIILISDDIPELIQTCDRILLMRRGRIEEEFKRENISVERLNKEMVTIQPLG
jgi:simple sugar transport system ATP-binding protein